jgi:hypothetical protein
MSAPNAVKSFTRKKSIAAENAGEYSAGNTCIGILMGIISALPKTLHRSALIALRQSRNIIPIPVICRKKKSDGSFGKEVKRNIIGAYCPICGKKIKEEEKK